MNTDLKTQNTARCGYLLSKKASVEWLVTQKQTGFVSSMPSCSSQVALNSQILEKHSTIFGSKMTKT